MPKVLDIPEAVTDYVIDGVAEVDLHDVLF